MTNESPNDAPNAVDIAWLEPFRLGHLETERPNPETTGLAETLANSVPSAIAMMLSVDRAATRTMCGYADSIAHLAEQVGDTFRTGNRVFACGCGATGRTMTWSAP